MKIFVWANCQGRAVKAFLPLLVGDRTELEISHVENYLVFEGKVALESFIDDVKAADVFIYQPVLAWHGFLSTVPNGDNLMGVLKPGCETVSFPCIYNDGLWPCFAEPKGVRNGEAIDPLLEAGATDEDIGLAYDRGDLNFNLLERTEKSLEVLRNWEAETDVQIHDFLRDRISSEQLFLTENHPTTAPFMETTLQICRRLFGEPFVSALPDDAVFDRNFVDLPGRYPIDRYAVDELGHAYQREPDPDAAAFYKSMLVAHAQQWRDNRATLANGSSVTAGR